jgi:protein TonB
MNMTGHSLLPRFLAASLLAHLAGVVALAPQAPGEEPPGRSLATQLLPASRAAPATAGAGRDGGSAAIEDLTRIDRADDRLKTAPAARDAARAFDGHNAAIDAGAAPGATRAQPASPAAESVGQQIRQQLLAAMHPYFDYPLLARRLGWQGEVQIAVHVARDGRLTALRLTRSSGFPVLDAAALTSLGKVRRLPDTLTRHLDDQGFDLRVPVVYRLTAG